jgi:hypothetical protein
MSHMLISGKRHVLCGLRLTSISISEKFSMALNRIHHLHTLHQHLNQVSLATVINAHNDDLRYKNDEFRQYANDDE